MRGLVRPRRGVRQIRIPRRRRRGRRALRAPLLPRVRRTAGRRARCPVQRRRHGLFLPRAGSRRRFRADFRLIDEESGAEVPADIAPPGIAAGPCYRLAPKAPLALPRRRYRVEISPCIAAADGARLDVDRSTAPCTSRFTTGAIPDTYAPYFFFYQHRAEAVSASAIALSWFPAIDPAGGSPFHRLRYAVYQGPSADAIGYDRPVLLTLPGTLQCVVGGLEPATDYCFVIRPRDEAGNEDDNTVAVGARTFFAADTTRIALLYTADVFGNLEPCG